MRGSSLIHSPSGKPHLQPSNSQTSLQPPNHPPNKTPTKPQPFPYHPQPIRPPQHSLSGDRDICWDLHSSGKDPTAAWAAAAAAFPLLRLRFKGGAALALPPQRYLFAVEGGKRFCLGLFDNREWLVRWGWGGAVIACFAGRVACIGSEWRRPYVTTIPAPIHPWP